MIGRKTVNRAFALQRCFFAVCGSVFVAVAVLAVLSENIEKLQIIMSIAAGCAMIVFVIMTFLCVKAFAACACPYCGAGRPLRNPEYDRALAKGRKTSSFCCPSCRNTVAIEP